MWRAGACEQPSPPDEHSWLYFVTPLEDISLKGQGFVGSRQDQSSMNLHHQSRRCSLNTRIPSPPLLVCAWLQLLLTCSSAVSCTPSLPCPATPCVERACCELFTQSYPPSSTHLAAPTRKGAFRTSESGAHFGPGAVAGSHDTCEAAAQAGDL